MNELNELDRELASASFQKYLSHICDGRHSAERYVSPPFHYAFREFKKNKAFQDYTKTLTSIEHIRKQFSILWILKVSILYIKKNLKVEKKVDGT